ncbi:MAG TPA: type II toxin-antitoxin system death-on-curing family toxin [Candidatus Saccharimonadales bacterium]|nr:type II toxin-antitoxin system death-on-curing family toxin [Candidatus Saccharimonadales bacterium]
MAIKPLSVGEVEFIAHELACRWFDQTEPIPEFSTRYPAKLESCLQQPFLSFAGLDPYPTLIEKAAILFYLVTKNHPFLNGNKRLAVTIMLNFLAKNGKWIDVSSHSLYEIAVLVAESRPIDKDDMVQALSQFLEKHLINFEPES